MEHKARVQAQSFGGNNIHYTIVKPDDMMGFGVYITMCHEHAATCLFLKVAWWLSYINKPYTYTIPSKKNFLSVSHLNSFKILSVMPNVP